ncbi:copper homeostasis protein CutC [Nocardioides donggukensis]|uniref:Copper homeostasis protein cutC homolog n=1 Tax=Nocardioides donggukensis TaxID=2774019 RepID=A0A927PYL9_9ACTN|nr:copper homeostasis protein CutC [Nocardioides donggukensis]MBD8868438.1 copper homeostasis protein CutC [Nocardioides donggukensis]
MPEVRVLLEVRVQHQRDVPGAVEGGADRLLLSTQAGLSPDLAVASAVLRESAAPVRVMLRLNDGPTTTGGEFGRLVGLAEEYLALGAEGVAFGFLDPDLEVDVETSTALAEALPEVPWTFHDVVDLCLEPSRAWRRLRTLPGLDAVLTAGSPRGLAVGYDDLLALAQSDPAAAALMLPGGGLVPEHVPWLARAGVRQVHVGSQVRPGGTDKAYVDAGHVRSWRLLLDS